MTARLDQSPEDTGDCSAHLTPRQIVEKIDEDRHPLSRQFLSQIPDNYRPNVEKVILRHEPLGQKLTQLVKSIKNSNTKFIFELLQFADERKYDNVKGANGEPHITFDVHASSEDPHIVIQFNDDGLSSEDVDSICDIDPAPGRQQGYVGDSKVGIRSVFQSAHRMEIASNGFFLSFTYGEGQSPLGIITPSWNEDASATASEFRRTEIKLFLHYLERAESQLGSITDTLLLFMRNIQLLSINTYDEQDHLVKSTTFRLHGTIPQISLTTESSQEETGETRRFHVTKHAAGDSEGQLNADNSHFGSEVVLAFPLSADTFPCPMDEDQKVYSFLPTRHKGFKFLVHANFAMTEDSDRILSASMSEANRTLLDIIAEGIVKAAREFRNDWNLQYRWVEWLPTKDRKNSPLCGLFDLIKARLATEKVWLTHGLERFESLTSLCSFPPDWTDANKQPLFSDADSAYKHISLGYSDSSVSKLLRFGLANFTQDDKLALIERDLVRTAPQSCWKNNSKSRDWYLRVSEQLCSLLDDPESGDDSRSRLEKLRMIPLTNGTWITSRNATEREAVFPACENQFRIPANLGLLVLEPWFAGSSGAEDVAELNIFHHLGVTQVKTVDVRRRIFEKPPPRIMAYEPLLEYVNCLKYLYFTEHLKDASESADAFETIVVYDQTLEARQPRKCDRVFVQTEDRYGASELMGVITADTLDGPFPSFIHQDFLDFAPEQHSESALPWIDWLQSRLGLLSEPTLVHPGEPSQLSEEFRHINKHRPERFLDAVHRYWTGGDDEELLRQTIRETHVLCRDNTWRPLEETFVPCEVLERIWENYGNTSSFPSPEVDVGDDSGPLWDFLQRDFGVSDEPNLTFYFCALERLRSRSFEVGLEDGDQSLIGSLYFIMHDLCSHSEDQDSNLEMVRRRFHDPEIGLIYHSHENAWYSADHCLWYRASQGGGRVGLQDIYEGLQDFFQHTIQVQTLTFEDAYNVLLNQGNVDPSPSEDKIVRSIWEFNSLLQDTELTEEQRENLRKSKIFPVRLATNGEVSFQTADANFFICDDEELSEAFSESIDVLNFTPDEIEKLEKFLRELKIDDRYATNRGTETTICPANTKPLLQEKEDREFRIAIHYKSPRADDSSRLHEILRDAALLLTDKVTTELRLGHCAALREKGDVHVEGEDSLKIYLPEDDYDRAYCFYWKLPERLLKWLMSEPGCNTTKPTSTAGALGNMTSALNGTPQSLSQILDEQNFRPWKETSGVVDSKNGIHNGHAKSDALRSSYGKMLERVISGARGEDVMGCRRASIQCQTKRADVEAEKGLKWDVLVGTAGELYAFELLLKLNLPGFGLHCWTSQNRHHVADHHAYRHITEVSEGRADITFHDIAGSLTNFLIREGKLDSCCANMKPTYLIEVKTTTGSDEGTEFKLSRAQEANMNESNIARHKQYPQGMVYVLLRIWRLLEGNVYISAHVNSEGKGVPDTIELVSRDKYFTEWRVSGREG